MGSYLQTYGVADERRGRMIKRLVIAGASILILLLVGYMVFHNYPEKRVANSFLEKINAKDYQGAYRLWGCTEQHPCPNYDFNRFMADWGPASKAESSWKVASVDGCRTFVTVNVQAKGTELQSLAVQRSDKSLGFAPAPECQEKQWRWRQFFNRILHRTS